MKKTMTVMLALCMLLFCAAALGELGFAEVRMDSVNVRDAAGGKMIFKVDAPQSVYVFEEKTVGKHLWCHVCTYRGKNDVEGWIRGDMLRFLSEEFTDILDVVAGRSYVMGLRADGTVAIMGDDMPHAPCIDSVRGWKNICEIGTRVCSAYGLTADGTVRAVGLQKNFHGIRAAHIGTGYPYPLDAEGRFLYDEWKRAWEDGGNWRLFMGEAVLGDTPLAEVIGESVNPRYVLTKDGRVIFTDVLEGVKEFAADVRYVGLAGYHAHTVALREDGRVDVIFCRSDHVPCSACTAVAAWTDVVQVDAMDGDVVGLRADGTVLYAGEHAWMARQIPAWTGVARIALGEDCCIALFPDGHVEMAGKRKEGYFR